MTLFVSVYLFVYETEAYSRVCRYEYVQRDTDLLVTCLTSVFLPLLIMSVLYGFIIIEARKHVGIVYCVQFHLLQKLFVNYLPKILFVFADKHRNQVALYDWLNYKNVRQRSYICPDKYNNFANPMVGIICTCLRSNKCFILCS